MRAQGTRSEEVLIQVVQDPLAVLRRRGRRQLRPEGLGHHLLGVERARGTLVPVTEAREGLDDLLHHDAHEREAAAPLPHPAGLAEVDEERRAVRPVHDVVALVCVHIAGAQHLPGHPPHDRRRAGELRAGVVPEGHLPVHPELEELLETRVGHDMRAAGAAEVAGARVRLAHGKALHDVLNAGPGQLRTGGALVQQELILLGVIRGLEHGARLLARRVRQVDGARNAVCASTQFILRAVELDAAAR
mmetsp:Transcript_86272/g.244526  ORF Transcript_86272/g.244526 Transcript_86272/m.244526 type:complete len:247 (+) Transcript_86272:144-884(+)